MKNCGFYMIFYEKNVHSKFLLASILAVKNKWMKLTKPIENKLEKAQLILTVNIITQTCLNIFFIILITAKNLWRAYDLTKLSSK